jgi:glutaredoxin
MHRLAVLAGVLATTLGLAGCEPERPPAPETPAAAAEADTRSELFFAPGQDGVVLTFATDRGAFTDSSKVEDVPEGSRGLVRVTLVGGSAAPPGKVWVANLDAPEPDGRIKLSTVDRSMFEELALGQGHASAVELPEGLEPPSKPVAPAGGIVVYKTDWCGVCKKVESYLGRKGVAYEAKDIEKDREAAAELQAKAQKAGIRTGSVPVIDVAGELIVGFDRARLEKLLAG